MIQKADSDEHNILSGVWILTFNLGGVEKKIVYKPSSITIDFLVMGKVKHVNEILEIKWLRKYSL